MPIADLLSGQGHSWQQWFELLLYGAGLRREECCRLRVHDLDLRRDQVIVRHGKGGKDRVVMLPKSLKPEVKVWGAEPETAAPGALSFAKQSPQAFTEWKQSFVDGAGGKSIFPRMWERMRLVADGSIVVSLEETRRAMRLLAEKTRVIAEGAGALSVAAALSGKAGKGPIVAVVSGGNVDLDKFYELISHDS